MNLANLADTPGYYYARAFIAGEFAASLEWQIFYYAVNQLDGFINVVLNILFLIVIHVIVFGIMYGIEKRYREESQAMEITGRELLSVVSISIVVFALSNMSYVYKNTPFSSQFAAEIFIIRTMADLGGVAVLYAYHVKISELQTKFEVKKLQNMLSMQYENYQMAEKSIEIVNQKYHDLKHQIEVLRFAANTKESIDYLHKMEKEIKSYEAQNKTGNKILDTMDISTLFGNALDNAIESVNKIQDADKRLIHLAVMKQKDFLRVRVENYYEEELIFENGLPVTTKKDKEYHGYGLKSIRSTVKKYGESVTIYAQKGWFELRILIPISELV